jgi:hypothetical protein
MIYSYLDYFIRCGLPNYDFRVEHNFCNTDHLTLELRIDKSDMLNLVKVREVIDSHDRTKTEYLSIGKLLSMVLTSSSPTEKLLELIGDFTKVYKPIVRKP